MLTECNLTICSCSICTCSHLRRYAQAGHVDRTGHTSKTSSFNDRRDSRDQPDAAQAAQSSDFETVYNQGLSLQEKASQAGGSTQGQLDLLKQVSQSEISSFSQNSAAYQLTASSAFPVLFISRASLCNTVDVRLFVVCHEASGMICAGM